MTLQPTKLRHNLHQQVVNELGLRIVRGDISPGATFPNEADLSLQLGVSRTVTREAIKVLKEKGLVVSRPKTGTQVQPRSKWNLLDSQVLEWAFADGAQDSFLHQLTEIRLIIESAASEMAAQRASPEEINAIEKAFHDMEASVDEVDAYIAADMQFHAAIVRASSNEFLEQIVNVIRVALISSRRVTVQVPGSSRAALPLHLAVLDAIRSHQPQNACRAMCHLIVRARSDIDEIMGHTDFLGTIDRG